MANVRFIKTTKEKHLKRDTYDPNALYFCEDTISLPNILIEKPITA